MLVDSKRVQVTNAHKTYTMDQFMQRTEWTLHVGHGDALWGVVAQW